MNITTEYPEIREEFSLSGLESAKDSKEVVSTKRLSLPL
jgi:hypothetical protein